MRSAVDHERIERAFLASLMACVDGPVTEFGGRSLRAVVQEQGGAERVARWLRQVENTDIQELALAPDDPPPRSTFDHAPVWDALGLMEYRRRYLALGQLLDVERVRLALARTATRSGSG